MRKLLRDIKYSLWALNGFVGLKYGAKRSQKVTVFLTYYNPVRMKHINNQLRNILCCEFVGQVIISNHNPDVKIETLVKVRDTRITTIDQDVRQGCGYRWMVAEQFSPEYLIVVDDDILLFPWQLRTLFESLVLEPDIPHGFAGMVRHPGDFLEYREKETRVVDYICEIYAITGKQLKEYAPLRQEILKHQGLGTVVDFAADFMLVSQTGNGSPKIHDAGRMFRCPTYNEAGVAVHKENEFDKGIMDVAKMLDTIRLKTGTS